jgi:hypothetical protein
MYGPNLSEFGSVSVRRLAWGLGTNMAAAIDKMAAFMPSNFSKQVICPRCKDASKCALCAFNGANPAGSVPSAQ